MKFVPSFFVGGFARSGTSLLTSILNSSPHIFCAQDTGFMTSAKFSYSSMVRDREPDSVLPFIEEPFSIFPHGGSECVGFSMSRFVNIEQFNHIDLLSALNQESLSLSLGGFAGKDVAVYTNRILYGYLFELWFRGFSANDPRKDRYHGSHYLSCLDSKIYANNQCSDTYLDLFHRFLFLFCQHYFPGKCSSSNLICGEKTPENLFSIDLIKFLYPEAKFLCVVRDPVAIFGAKKERFGWSVEKFAQATQLEFIWLKYMKESIKVIRYEDMVAAPEDVLGECLEFLLPTSMIAGSDETIKSSDQFNLSPGVYEKYVGNSIDPARDISNIAKVDDTEKSYLYSALDELYQSFY